jgi:nitroimidazol reductase NimA-like FMN-containing flavoprotein (pyridoxamine 5'-phosphate oxidase superfamily)
MRRSDREVKDTIEIIAIINANKVCRLAMSDGGKPYVIPLNYGYECAGGELTLYFHGAGEGKKIGILKKNPEVCFEMDGEHQLTVGGTDCEYGFDFASVIGFGTASFIEDTAEKKKALTLLMKRQCGEDREFDFPAPRLDAVTVFKVVSTSFTGKRRRLSPAR